MDGQFSESELPMPLTEIRFMFLAAQYGVVDIVDDEDMEFISGDLVPEDEDLP